MFGRKLIQVAISAAAYDEIALAMVNAGAAVALVDGALDMRSIGLVRSTESAPLPRHRPISGPVKKNTAPGAI
jgi:hypothetical protein